MAKRNRFDSKTKIKILKKHLQKKEQISELCKEFGCIPESIYQWQEILFNRGEMVFESTSNKVGRPKDQNLEKAKNREIEEKIKKKDSIIAFLSEELLKEKKFNGVL